MWDIWRRPRESPDLIKTALCLQHREIPKTLHFENPNPQIAFDDLRLRLRSELEPWPETHGQPPRAGVNSFGFGGTNGHAILEAAPDAEIAARMRRRPADDRRLDAAAFGAQRSPRCPTWRGPISTRFGTSAACRARRCATSAFPPA